MLESARASMGMSKAELARRGRLPPETVRRLLTSNEANPHFSMVADLLKPAGLGLFVGKLDVPAEECAGRPRPRTGVAGSSWRSPLRLDDRRPGRRAGARTRARRGAATRPSRGRRRARSTRGALSHAQASRLQPPPSHGSRTGTRTEHSGSSSTSAPSFRETGSSRARRDRSRRRHAAGSARRNSSSCEARRSGAWPS